MDPALWSRIHANLEDCNTTLDSVLRAYGIDPTGYDDWQQIDIAEGILGYDGGELTLAELINRLVGKLAADEKRNPPQTVADPQQGAGVATVESDDNPQSHLSKVMSPADAGKLFGVSAKTFTAWFDDGKIRGKKITNKAYQIHLEDLPRLERK
ncbi:MAG: hypothetical protein NTY19_18410 [Planctomycetota bacterium]|nr:hypothetical protein [Planctomycetota bacterium]